MSDAGLPAMLVVDDDELSWGVEGVGGKVVGGTVQAVPGGDRGI